MAEGPVTIEQLEAVRAKISSARNAIDVELEVVRHQDQQTANRIESSLGDILEAQGMVFDLKQQLRRAG